MTQDRPRRHTYIAPGRYSTSNPWGRVPKGGTQLCRFYELEDKLEAELMRVLEVIVPKIPGLVLALRPHNLSSVQWYDDPGGAYAIGSGLHHEPTRPESDLDGFLWLQYSSDRLEGANERPLDVRIEAPYARDAAYRVDLIIAAVKMHHRLMRTRDLIPA